MKVVRGDKPNIKITEECGFPKLELFEQIEKLMKDKLTKEGPFTVEFRTNEETNS